MNGTDLRYQVGVLREDAFRNESEELGSLPKAIRAAAKVRDELLTPTEGTVVSVHVVGHEDHGPVVAWTYHKGRWRSHVKTLRRESTYVPPVRTKPQPEPRPPLDQTAYWREYWASRK